ncbi:MAG TPA: hypothetical protein VH988_01225 [Thermoanaerobaculia bacterium]|jgi:hypothetical protein|nr:hypothetical protein [Thermoanaerobaculia bacterium]
MSASPHPPLSRILRTVLLLAVLAVPSVRAAEPVAHHGAAGPSPLLDLLSRAWASLVNLLPDNGCIADPSGRCKAAAALDNGCGIDPDGRCKTAAALDNGCIIDPDGRCKAAAALDNGCSLDPDGRCRSGS